MDALCDLLFELSNDDRLQILYEIKKNPIKLSHISKKLNFTTQATARNIYRLAEFGIIRKKENSDYILTPFGTTSLALLDSYHFITENKGYLLSHWTKKLPPEFISRLGDLRNCVRINDPLEMTAIMERVFREAEEYHQYISPFRAISHNSLKHVVEKLDEGLKIRNIEEISYRVPETAIANTPEEDRFGLERHWKKGNMQLRYIEKIDVRINMSEKEVSIFTLPDLDGKVDMFGFASDDPLFHKWCEDLFNYYWEKGKTKTVFEL